MAAAADTPPPDGPGPGGTPRSLVVLKLSAIGDTVHAVPAVAALREAFPAATLAWCVEKRCAALVRCLPLVDVVLEMDTRSWRRARRLRGEGGLFPFLKKLRALRPDAAVDFQGLLKSAATARLSGAPVRVGWSRPFLREKAAALLYNRKVDGLTGEAHVIDQCSALLRAFGISGVPRRFPYVFPPEAERRVDGLLAPLGQAPFVVLNPGGGWPTKRWAPGRFGELAARARRELGLPAVVTIGPGERDLADAVAAVDPSVLVLETGLVELAVLSRRAAAFVAGDTGPLHIACAAGARALGLFGPTRAWRNGPFSPGSLSVSLDTPCAGCHRRSCPKGQCMDIPVPDVYNALSGMVLTGERPR